MERYRPGARLEGLARELVRQRFPEASSSHLATGAAIYGANDAELGAAGAGDWAVEHAWLDAAQKLLPVGYNLADEWKPWAARLTRAVRSAVETGISAELFSAYPNPVEGFCFELFADLPNSRPPFRADVLGNLAKLQEFQEVDALFLQKYGRHTLDMSSK